MMVHEAQELLDRYLVWLRDKTQLWEVGRDWVEITTPYLDRHNDCLQVYARRDGDSILLTDDGYIISDLLQCGCKLDTPKREALLKVTLAGLGVQERDGRLEVRATRENFGLRKHSLVQAMLAVNDLFALAVPTVASLFYEDVVLWLDSCEIRYTPNVKFTGKSGYDHMFDFVVPKSRVKPERVLQTMTQPSKDAAESLAFRWIDTREVRSPESRAYAIVNDIERRIPSGVCDALRSYDIEPVPFSERDKVADELAA